MINSNCISSLNPGEPQLTGTGTLTVNVVDVNDNGPRLEKDSFWLPKSIREGAQITRIKIVDDDSPDNGPPFEVSVCQNQNTPGCRDLRFETQGSKLPFHPHKDSSSRTQIAESYLQLPRVIIKIGVN